MGVLTYRKAKKVLAVGEDVFLIQNGKVETLKIKHIYADCISVDGGFLAYETAGDDWWLSKKGATDALRKREEYEQAEKEEA